MAGYPVHQAAMHGEDPGTGVQPCTTRARYPVHAFRVPTLGKGHTAVPGTEEPRRPVPTAGAPAAYPVYFRRHGHQWHAASLSPSAASGDRAAPAAPILLPMWPPPHPAV
jgi:hypothetical protein